MTISKRRTYATLCGFAAIGLWASLALLTTLTEGIPPFALSVSRVAGFSPAVVVQISPPG
jgi:hypothetical protein